MKSLDFIRCALSGCVAAATLLAGCGGSQPPIGEAGAMPQGSAIAEQSAHGKSWMLPETKSQSLLYVSDASYYDYNDYVYVYSYPSGSLVGTLTGFTRPRGLCANMAGRVFVTDTDGGKVFEYLHGGTAPIRTFVDTNSPAACAVDQDSGDLAVANYVGSVTVYRRGRGKPTIYAAPWPVWFVGYDNTGNLFAEGFHYDVVVAELFAMGSAFTTFGLDVKIKMPAAGVQWFQDRLTIGRENPYEYGCCGKINRFIVDGTSGQKVGTTKTREMVDYFIDGSTVVASSGYNRVEIFGYPHADSYSKVIDTAAKNAYGVVVSH